MSLPSSWTSRPQPQQAAPRINLLVPQLIALVVIREGRNGYLRHRMGLQVVQHQLNASFELDIVACRHILGQLFDSHVGSDAVVLDLPLAVESVDSVTGRVDMAAVEQRERALTGRRPSPDAGERSSGAASSALSLRRRDLRYGDA